MKSFSSIVAFFIKTGGHDPEAATQCTTDETLRMEQRGSLVFVPTFIAFLGMCTSVWTVSQNMFLSFIVGFVWSMIVFKIDVALMSGTASLLSFSGIGRIVFAITASFIVAECMIMVVFQDTINEKNQAIFQKYSEQSTVYYDSIKTLEYNKLVESKEDRDEKFRIFREEIDGSGGSSKRGWGIIGDTKYANYQSAAKAYSADSTSYSRIVTALEARNKKEINKFRSSRANDIAGKLKTLNEVENPYVHIAIWFLRILHLMAELMPLFLKYQPSKPSDIYDKVVAMQAQALLHNIEIESRLNTEVAVEKSKSIGKIAKIQADLETDIKEMDLNELYVNQMSDRYDRYTRQYDIEAGEGSENSKIKNISDRIDSIWQKMMTKIAS